jgi:molybdate transport system regulatory protein
MNTLTGTISHVDSADGIHLIEVDAGGTPCTATVTGDGFDQKWLTGQQVMLAFREQEVSLAKHLSGLISIRNMLPCTIREIEHGKVLTRIVLNFAGQSIESVITRRSAIRLNLAPGDEVDALIKSSDMMLLANGM